MKTIYVSAIIALCGPALWPSPETVVVQVRQAACGAILRDDFSAGSFNSAWWTPSSVDPGIRVEIDNGELCIRGTSAEIPDTVLRKNLGVLSRYAGLYSRNFAQTDSALAVRVKMVSGIANEPGAHVVNVHLCGVEPDCYSEVLFGKLDSATMERLMREYAGLERPYQEARGWWFGITNQDPGRHWWRVSGKPVAELGDERSRFHDVVVDYDEPSRTSRAWLETGKGWIQVGEAEKVVRGVSKIELKVTNVSPLHGTSREARFDDCRLYPNPRRNPVRLVVKNGAEPYRGERLRAVLCSADGHTKVSEAATDAQGMAALAVDSPAWVAFPVSALLRIFQGAEEVARSTITARGIEGLYPGDVWVLDTKSLPAK